jgi:hypothetical protein
MKPIEIIPPLPLPPQIRPNMSFKRQLEALGEQGKYYDIIGKELALKMRFPTNTSH